MRRFLLYVVFVLYASLAEAQTAFIATNIPVPADAWDVNVQGGINNHGIAAGAFSTQNGRHAFVFISATGELVDLGTLGGRDSSANDINNGGVVVGRSMTATGVGHAFRYSPVAGVENIHALLTLGGDHSSALAVNDEGDIVGWSDTPDGSVHAVHYDSSTGALTDLHVAAFPSALSSVAYGLDSGGNVVGTFERGDGSPAGFTYSMGDESLIEVGTLGGNESALAKINNGRAVGVADVTAGESRAIAVHRGESTTDLGTLGGELSAALDIANTGAIVGAASVVTGETYAFLYTKSSGMRDLNTLIQDIFWVLLEAQGLNDSGLIVGTGYFDGEFRAFLLTPLGDTTSPVISLPPDFSVDPTTETGAVVNFSMTATDDVDGTVVTTCVPASGFAFPIGTTPVSCTASDLAGNTSGGSFTVTVRTVCTITWQNPVSIVDGTPLSAVQLNATANVPGTFVYTPPLGSLLAVGTGQPLSVTFTPADSAHYTTAQMQVAIDVVAPGPPAPATFHAIGDLPGGATISDIRDATRVGGVLYGVGASASHDQTLCISFNNPAGCVPQYNPDTALLWTFDGVNRTLTPLPDVVTPAGTPVNPLFASAITRDAAYIASQARSNVTDPAQMHAVRLTRTGLLNLDLSAAPFPANNQPAAGQAISEDGSIVYGVEGVPFRARRFDVSASTSVQIPLLPGDTSSFIAARGVSFDGSVMVGTSFVFPFTGTNGRAFRYVHSSPVGTVSAIPLLAGGTWNRALGVSPDGRTTLVAGNSTSLPNGEIYLYDAVAGTTTALGSPMTPWAPERTFASNSFLIVNFAGMSADGSVVAATFADRTDNASDRRGNGYIRNARGWFHLATVLAEQGINLQADGWAPNRIQINGISPDGTLVFGSGRRNGNVEGFVVEFSPGYLASFDVPIVAPTDTSIVGVWTDTGTGGEEALAFLADGTYFHIDAVHASQPAGEFSAGFERGRYRWNASTGAFSWATLQDTNGSVGLSSGNGVLGITATVTGDTLDVGNGGMVLHRVVGGLDSIAGGWLFGDPRVHDSSALFVFLPDGAFLVAEDGNRELDPGGHDGVEAGTYIWNAANGAFTATVTVDTTSGWGLSNGPGTTNRTLLVSPDGLRLDAPDGSIELRRIVDPQAVVPVITSVLSTMATSGYAFAYQITATRVPSSYGAIGLPAGLSINASTGLISGSSTQTGIFDVTISASNTLSTGIAHLQLAVIAPIVTAAGSNVVVTPTVPPAAAPVPVALQFQTVAQSGVTAVTAIDPATLSDTLDLPAGFSFGDPALYFEIQTTASFDGPVSVCFNYAATSFSGFPRLLHYELPLASWVDITTSVDAATSTICGLTASLSPFALASSPLAAAGFHAPIGPLAGDVNVVNGGSTVPLKFNVYRDGGIEITNWAEISNLSFTVASIACTAGEAEALVPFMNTGSTGLRYDTSGGQFVQNWKTPRTPGCYVVRVTGNGLLLTARFRVR